MSHPGRILIVEDDGAIRQTVAELLEDEGYEVECAVNGADALTRLERSEVPALILLDLTMPVMDGWSFRATQRRDPRLAGIPTVVVTASLTGDPSATAELAADALLPKPFDLDRLIATVQKLC